ncbi:hypothetical protein [Magpiepox virus 2]|nr:hypothetical protein [Magpiepox virus 2]
MTCYFYIHIITIIDCLRIIFHLSITTILLSKYNKYEYLFILLNNILQNIISVNSEIVLSLLY